MKNVTFLLVSLLLMAFLTSCIAEELPVTQYTIQTDTIDDLAPKDDDGEPPVRTIPPIKIP